MSAVSVNMELQKDNEKKWELAIKLLDKMNLTNIINLMNHKYGWQSGDDVEDTKHDIILITFNIFQKYEQETGKTFSTLSDITNEDYACLKTMIIGKYRNKVWKNRSDRNMRMSDIYNIQHSSDGDTHLYFTNMPENDIVDSSTLTSKEDENIKNDLRILICRKLITILKPDLAKMIDANILGNNIHGLLTHKQIAVNSSRCRSSVTRRINRGLKFLTNFITEHNISMQQLNNPTKQDLIIINDIVKEYKNNKLFKKQKITYDTSKLNIEYFLKANKCSLITTKNKSSTFLNPSPERKKRVKTIMNVALKIHSIEEFLC